MFSYRVSNFQRIFYFLGYQGELLRGWSRYLAKSVYDSLSFAIPSNIAHSSTFRGLGGGGERQTRITDLSLKRKIEGVQKRRPLLEILSEK